MTNDEYRMHMDAFMGCVRMLLLIPVGELLDNCEKASTLAPLLDPTAYIRGGSDNLDDQLELLHAANGLVAAAERVKKRRVVEVS